MSNGRRPSAQQQRAWLEGDPPVAQVRERFPAEWAQVQRELAQVVDRDDVEAIKAYASRVARPPKVRDEREAVSAMARQRLAADALRQMGVAAATGVTSGRLRFGFFSGRLTQKLLFEGGGLRRKPVSLRRFRLLWPLVRQKRYLMPLVEPRGIYCFYSDRLVTALAALIGDRTCVEIAAGDGTLTRFLRDAGADVVATDDGSWSQTRDGADVVVEDARTSLRDRRPRVVLCSWPPAGNAFEQWVFKTPTVETYIVIGSRSEFAAGNWDAYRAATTGDDARFELTEDPNLSALVLPPEIAPAVYVFWRRASAAA